LGGRRKDEGAYYTGRHPASFRHRAGSAAGGRMNWRRIRLPEGLEELKKEEAGNPLLLSGTVHTARDQAHVRLVKALEDGGEPPFELRGSVIFYAGPAPAPPGRPAGSLGPTTSSRMDPFTPALLERGVAAIIGKGPRSDEVKRSFAVHGAVYLVAVGGAAALLGTRVRSMELVAYPDLGAEAVYRLLLEDFPVVVAYDARGGDVFYRE